MHQAEKAAEMSTCDVGEAAAWAMELEYLLVSVTHKLYHL